MPKFKNLAVLAAAFEAGRRYARSNPDKASQYVDQAAAFVDKQTKGKYSGQIDGMSGKVKGAVGLPQASGTTTGFEAGAGYGAPGYGTTPPVTPPVTPSTTTPPATATGPSGTRSSTNGPATSKPSTDIPSPLTSTRPTSTPTGPDKPTERNLPGSRDI